MKVVRVRRNTVGPITELTGELEDRPLSWCLENGIPWVAPHKDLKNGDVRWLASSPLPYFRQWYEEPHYEKEMVTEADGVYAADIPVPNVTADTLMIRLVTKKTRYLVMDTSEFQNIGELEDFARKERKELDRELQEGRWAVLPSWFDSAVVRDLEDASFLDMGFRFSRTYERMAYVEVRYWKDPERIDRLDSSDGVVILDASKPQMIVLSADGELPFPTEVGTAITDGDLTGFIFASPVKNDKAEIVIPTPLADLDEVFVPRTHLRGQMTATQLGPYLSRRLGQKLSGIDEIAEALGRLAEAKDSVLMAALGAPRMVVSGEAGQGTTTWVRPAAGTSIPKPCDLQAVREALPELIDPNDDGTSDLLVNMVARACVVMHLRNTSVFDSVYKSPMFEYSTLFGSLMRAGPGDAAGYLTPLLMIGTLDRRRQPVIERKKRAGGGVSTSPLIGDRL